jgi:hypothetical protein
VPHAPPPGAGNGRAGGTAYRFGAARARAHPPAPSRMPSGRPARSAEV